MTETLTRGIESKPDLDLHWCRAELTQYVDRNKGRTQNCAIAIHCPDPERKELKHTICKKAVASPWLCAHRKDFSICTILYSWHQGWVIRQCHLLSVCYSMNNKMLKHSKGSKQAYLSFNLKDNVWKLSSLTYILNKSLQIQNNETNKIPCTALQLCSIISFKGYVFPRTVERQ